MFRWPGQYCGLANSGWQLRHTRGVRLLQPQAHQGQQNHQGTPTYLQLFFIKSELKNRILGTYITQIYTAVRYLITVNHSDFVR